MTKKERDSLDIAVEQVSEVRTRMRDFLDSLSDILRSLEKLSMTSVNEPTEHPTNAEDDIPF